MLTRCPGCATHFRVTADQIKVRSGRVRCGQCQHVFNALDSLIEEPALALAHAARGADPAPVIVHPEVPANAIEELRAEESAPPPSPDTTAEVARTAESWFPGTGDDTTPEVEMAPTELPDPEPAATSIADTGTWTAETAAVTDTDIDGEASPVVEHLDTVAAAPDADALEANEALADTEGEAPWDEAIAQTSRPRRRWPWALGSSIALVALAAQALLAFRVELATLWPDLRPALTTLCDVAGCDVGLPAKAGLVSIEASDLHPDGGTTGRLVMTATIKNRAPFAQQFPHLELTLTDTADKAVARKVLTPADYLAAKTPLAEGMPANADVQASVVIDAGGLAASGYRLYLFYP